MDHWQRWRSAALFVCALNRQWQAMAEGAEAGDAFTVTRLQHKAEFDNRPNSRGFPHVPWIYFALTHTDRSDKNDGESMN
jgi:hypothetical protein